MILEVLMSLREVTMILISKIVLDVKEIYRPIEVTLFLKSPSCSFVFIVSNYTAY